MPSLIPLTVARRLRPVAGLVGSRWVSRGTAVVLMYHRVAQPSFDPWRLCVSEAHFDEHMAVLRQHFQPMPLTELARELDGPLSRRAVAVTFDDGYRDGLVAAKPVLERHGIPATVFVASGYVGSARDFWWLELERLCFDTGRPRFGLFEHDELSADWSTPTDQLYLELWRQLQPLVYERRLELLDVLRSAVGSPLPGKPNTLSEAELAELAEGGLVEIGGHTVNHPDLATLPVQAQLQEMRTGRLHLESLVGRSVSSFSFPHGAFTDASVRLVAEAGFERSCVSVPGPVRVGADRFRLPRRHVDDWRGDEFAWHLSRFFR